MNQTAMTAEELAAAQDAAATEIIDQILAERMTNYHLTESGAAWTVGSTNLSPGYYPANDNYGRSADAYVAPGDYVEEWGRRRLDYADPQSDGCLRAAIEAHRAGDPLPPEPAPGEVRWQPPPADLPEIEPRRRRTDPTLGQADPVGVP